MIQTATEVILRTDDRLGDDISTIIYSEVKDILIQQNGYSIPVIEWIIEEVEIVDENGETQMIQQKKIVHDGKKRPSFRTFAQISQLEGLLKDKDALNDMGMGALEDVYESFTDINEQLMFIMKIGHLIQNNLDNVRKRVWILSE